MKNIRYTILITISIFVIITSCKKFVEIDPPKNSLVPSTVFKSDELATSALLGIYQQMALNDYACNGPRSITTLCGLTADELIGYNIQTYKPFFDNQINPENAMLSAIWDNPYKRIFDANGIIEQLSLEQGITPTVASQLKGEAYFIRAFCYYYLINLFGEVPLHLSTNYQTNKRATRASVDKVYEQILSDLKTAEGLLGESYVTAERVRPNISTIHSLLSRVYLNLGKWENAEKYSGLVISQVNTYQLVPLDRVFLKNSQEAIWQLMPAPNSNTAAGNFYILASAPVNVSLRPDFVQRAFEQNDLRKISWIKSLVSSGVEYFYPFKYKVRSSSDVTEYSMVFRLAEQYLIRAEARAKQNNLSGSISDIDRIRARAGLPLIIDINPTIDQASLLTTIATERRNELFCEWGDRWFELKRSNRLSTVLSVTKPNWKTNFELFPIRISEINNNNNISQNPGY
ncbi:RagB/SusD family nutrient uptake outer membrane protein [Pedobacter cryotolerans]|uniref:RagB/SusD family nutrient uptake outer membrane protein n=1 Tax=Pedobacter cryotolerans TaxID=2571270 RepID=A0A4U1C3Z4_9SPHI|nr:RagB/SusD family nutrient uptake outer membrane protein [Pedobacter cryotolerans]TKC00028.1 RagB/SusD family nutrient uptake outer membrane protein [Pedobacter cryotolerans]